MGAAITGISGIVTSARSAIEGFDAIAPIGWPMANATPQRHGRSGTSHPAATPQRNQAVTYGTTAILPFGSARNGSLDTAAPTAMHAAKNHRG